MDDAAWMGSAIAAARAVVGTTTPNPSVGAVVVRDGTLLGTGATRPIGGHHAEVMALQAVRDAGLSARGATMYVTLEPCCHWGRTPPCTDAILEAEVRRVVVGTLDPFPAVGGKGLRALQAAGVEVQLGVREPACAALIRGFARAVLRGLPEVGVVTEAGTEVADLPTLRSTYDAVVVSGSGPVPKGARRLVVLDPTGRGATSPRVPTTRLAAEPGPTVTEVVPRSGDHLATGSVLRAIVRAGLHRVLFETDPGTSAALLRSGLVDDRWAPCAAQISLPGTAPRG